MATTVVVTRNVSSRIRGFLASSMLELTPGVYCSPRQSSSVRDRIWKVLEEWFRVEQNASIVMLYPDPGMPGGMSVSIMGAPPVDIVELDGMLLTRKRKGDANPLRIEDRKQTPQ